MKLYFTAPIKKLTATNIVKDKDGFLKYDKNVKVINNSTFYYNCFGVLVEKDTKSPPITKEEIPDIIEMDFKYGDKKISINYVDEDDLKLIKTEKPKLLSKFIKR